MQRAASSRNFALRPSANSTTVAATTSASANRNSPPTSPVRSPVASAEPSLSRAVTVRVGSSAAFKDATAANQQQQQNSSSSLPRTSSHSGLGSKRRKATDELFYAVKGIESFFVSAVDAFASISKQKQEVFATEVYDIAFINILASAQEKKEQEQQQEEEERNAAAASAGRKSLSVAASSSSASPGTTAAAGGSNNNNNKGSKDFLNFIRDTETKQALQLGHEAMELLNGSGGLESDVSETVNELKRQANFWKSVAERTHRHNTLLAESKKMLEGSAQRATQMQFQIQGLQEKVSESEKVLSAEQAQVKKLTSDNKSLSNQLATQAQLLAKYQKRLEQYEKSSATTKKEKDKESHTLADREKTLSEVQANLKQTGAAVDLLTQQLNSERAAHSLLRREHNRILHNRAPPVGTQTEVTGETAQLDSISLEFAQERVALVQEHNHETLLSLMRSQLRSERNAQVAEHYARDAITSVEEAQRVQENKDHSWGEQVKQLKLEAEAECRRADEERKKVDEVLQENETLRKRVRELSVEALQNRDPISRLQRGESRVVQTQTELSIDQQNGTHRSTNTASMSSQTESGWFSDWCLQSSRIESDMRVIDKKRVLLEKMKSELLKNQLAIMNSSSSNESKTSNNNNSSAVSRSLFGQQQQKRFEMFTSAGDEEENKKDEFSSSSKSSILKANFSVKASTTISGRVAKEAIQGAREVVRKILNASAYALPNSQTSMVQQRKELLGAIRALSESVTLCANHIKDLEGEVDRALGEADFAKPVTREEACFVTTDRRGLLVGDAGILVLPPSNNKNKSKETATSNVILDFGRGSNHLNLVASASTSASGVGGDYVSPIRDASTLSFTTMSPDVVRFHQQQQQQQQQQGQGGRNLEQTPTSAIRRRGSSYVLGSGINPAASSSSSSPLGATRGNSSSTSTAVFSPTSAASARSPAAASAGRGTLNNPTALEMLLDRGESLEQQQQQQQQQNTFTKVDTSSAPSSSSSSSSSTAMSKIEAAQRQAQAALQQSTSPVAFRNLRQRAQTMPVVTPSSSSSASSSFPQQAASSFGGGGVHHNNQQRRPSQHQLQSQQQEQQKHQYEQQQEAANEEEPGIEEEQQHQEIEETTQFMPLRKQQNNNNTRRHNYDHGRYLDPADGSSKWSLSESSKLLFPFDQKHQQIHQKYEHHRQHQQAAAEEERRKQEQLQQQQQLQKQQQYNSNNNNNQLQQALNNHYQTHQQSFSPSSFNFT